MSNEINEISDEKRHEISAEILRSLRSHGLNYCTARNILNDSLWYLDRIGVDQYVFNRNDLFKWANEQSALCAQYGRRGGLHVTGHSLGGALAQSGTDFHDVLP